MTSVGRPLQFIPEPRKQYDANNEAAFRHAVVLALDSARSLNDLPTNRTVIRTVTADYDLTLYDDVLHVDASSGARIVNVPDAALAIGICYRAIKKIDSTANTVTVAAADLIEGAATAVLSVPGESIGTSSNGSTWSIV